MRFVSNKRKLRRAQAQHSTPAASPAKSRDALRKQTAAERFGKTGSDKLWAALLGWEPDRLGRIWLAQAVHDGARAKPRGDFDPGEVVNSLRARVPRAVELDAPTAAMAVDVWLTSGDDYDSGDPAPKWHYLANLGAKLGLGSVSPEELQDDWESWTTLALAAGPRAQLMAALAQAEQAAVALHGLTKSDRINALVNLSRAMWTATAYGDDATFGLLDKTGREWLGTIAGKMRREA